jgi:hypothetical protein
MIPAKPPTTEPKILEISSMDAPQSVGSHPPMTVVMVMMIYMTAFDINSLYHACVSLVVWYDMHMVQILQNSSYWYADTSRGGLFCVFE